MITWILFSEPKEVDQFDKILRKIYLEEPTKEEMTKVEDLNELHGSGTYWIEKYKYLEI